MSFFDPRPSRRLQLGALFALWGVAAALLEVVQARVRARLGGAVVGGTELWTRAVAIALAFAIGALNAALAGPLWRHRWPAGALTALCLWPLAVVACAEHGRLPADAGAWVRSAVLALACGAWVVWRYPRLAGEMREHYVLDRAARLARVRRRAAG